jgi:uncharacterized protein
MEKEIKIVIADTNWWVSLAIKNFDNQFAKILQDDNLQFVSSDELTEEIKSTFQKERIQRLLPDNIVTRFWILYTTIVKNTIVHSSVTICSDSKDNFLLALARDAEADFLITGDKDLLDLQKFENTIICTLTEFIEKHLNK